MENENIEFWESVSKTDPKFTNEIRNGGRKFIAINAQYQLMNATKKWGKYGDKWGLRDIKLNYIDNLDKGQILCVSNAVFEYPEGKFEIGSSIFVQQFVKQSYLSIDSDFLKKLETDMLTKSLSKLGFNADVFLGKYDDNKYVRQMELEFSEQKQKPKLTLSSTELLDELNNYKDIDKLREFVKKFDIDESKMEIIKKHAEIIKNK